jgi:hypothetical protein
MSVFILSMFPLSLSSLFDLLRSAEIDSAFAPIVHHAHSTFHRLHASSNIGPFEWTACLIVTYKSFRQYIHTTSKEKDESASIIEHTLDAFHLHATHQEQNVVYRRSLVLSPLLS